MSLDFVFSFRSPFAWIAANRVLPMLDPETPIRWVPFYPLPTFTNFSSPVRAKLRYNIEDLLRLTEAYGLTLGRPPREDPDWSIPHSAFQHGARAGKGRELGLALMAARWERGEDIATEAVIGRVAEAVGLDREGVLEASRDEAQRRALTDEVEKNYHEHGIFGVPMIVTAEGERFWGHDRIEWGIRRGLLPGVVA
jgi:2-hydroxychromene-2-carboxylate isomerase